MRFSIGINYWPRRSAMHMWQRFDEGEIAEDMMRLAGLGFDSVRFFLRWADFQPEPDRVDPAMLARLESMMDIIASAGLRAMPTLFCGHMSSVNWLPSWSLDRSRHHGRFRTITEVGEEPYGSGDLYSGALLAAQRHHAREVGTVLRGHPAVLAWDLGNEFSNVCVPRSPADVNEWSKRLTDDLQTVSGHPVTGGIHGEDLTQDRNIRPSEIAEPWAFATMHGYSVYSHFSRGRTDAEVVPFLAALTASLSGKRLLFSEFGNPTCPPGKRSPYEGVPLPDEPPLPPIAADDPVLAQYACLSETEMAIYAREVLVRLHEAGRLGAYWWCWADYAADLRDTPPFDLAPHELSFGIVRSDGTLKPVGTAISLFAREGRTVIEPSDPPISEAAYYRHVPQTTSDAYARFLELHR